MQEGGGLHPGGGLGRPPGTRKAGGTHPTGMLFSCCLIRRIWKTEFRLIQMSVNERIQNSSNETMFTWVLMVVLLLCCDLVMLGILSLQRATKQQMTILSNRLANNSKLATQRIVIPNLWIFASSLWNKDHDDTHTKVIQWFNLFLCNYEKYE